MISSNQVFTKNNKLIVGALPSTTYNVMDIDDIINVDTSAGKVDIYLPNIKNSSILSSNRVIYINDIGNAVSINNITIYGSNGDLVNSSAFLVINQNGANIILQPANLTEWVGTGVGITPVITQDLQSTLAAGNVTGGNNIIVTTKDNIVLSVKSTIIFSEGLGGDLDSMSTTSYQNWSLPDQSGTIALLSDIFPPVSPTYLDPVISQINVPPMSVNIGDRYLVNISPTGVWVGNANSIAEWDGATWVYTIPVLDNVVFITNVLQTKRYNGVAWINYNGIALLQNGNKLSSSLIMGTNDNNVVFIKTNLINRVRFTNTQVNITGNLYIGNLTASASAKLHVRGTDTGATLSFLVQNSATNNLISIANDGTIAIGLNAISISASNVSIGINAQSLVNRGVAIGDSAISQSQGVSIGYASNTDDRGVAIGYSASNTSTGVSIGESSTAIGGISIKGTSILPSQIAIGGVVSGAGLIAFGSGTVSSSDNGIAIGFRSRALATDAIVIGRSLDNATFLDNSVAQSFGIGWSESTPTVLFAKTSTQYINGTGNLGIGTASPNASAKLEVTSTTGGFRLTPMTSAQASLITPVEGLMVNVSDTNGTFTSIGFWGYENGAWAKL